MDAFDGRTSRPPLTLFRAQINLNKNKRNIELTVRHSALKSLSPSPLSHRVKIRDQSTTLPPLSCGILQLLFVSFMREDPTRKASSKSLPCLGHAYPALGILPAYSKFLGRGPPYTPFNSIPFDRPPCLGAFDASDGLLLLSYTPLRGAVERHP